MPRCNDLPEGLDPRSFRASFGHNTNVWAFKRKPGTSDLTPPYLTIGGPSAVFPLDFDTTQNYFTPHDFGVQMRRCSDMPVQAQVSSRCRCREPEACGELDAAVEQAAKEGKFARSEDPVTLHF